MKNCKVCTSQEYFYLFNFFAKLKSSVESKNLKGLGLENQQNRRKSSVTEYWSGGRFGVWLCESFLRENSVCVMPETMDDPHCFFSCPYLLLSIHLDVEPVPA